MKKLKLFTIAVTMCLSAFLPSFTRAASLSLEPSAQSASIGDAVSLDLMISGLTAGGPDSLGDFDVDIGFDTTMLSFDSYVLGNALGDLSFGEAFDTGLGDLGGIINIAEVSLLEASLSTCVFCSGPYLDDIQPASFVLATLGFTVLPSLSPGTSTTVNIDTVWALGDGNGDALALNGVSGAVIRNPSQAAGVPEPASLALIISGVLGFIGVYRRRY